MHSYYTYALSGWMYLDNSLGKASIWVCWPIGYHRLPQKKNGLSSLLGISHLQTPENIVVAEF